MESSELNKHTQASAKITKEFLESFLPIWDKVKSFEVSEFRQSGVLSSDILLVKVYFENERKPLNLVVKTLPSCSAKQEWVRKLKLFPKEVFFYDTILPELKRLQSNCDNEEKACLRLTTPQLIAGGISSITNDSLATFMALTDLHRTRGFKCPKLHVGLDFDHCQLVMREIAKLHALSWVYRKTKAVKSLQVFHPVIQETFFAETNKEDLNALLKTNFDLFQKLMQTSLGNNSKEFQTIRNLNDKDFTSIFIKFLNPKGLNEREIEKEFLTTPPPDDTDFVEDSWAVGSHGDLQQSNLLFRYQSNTMEKPVEVALLDFQGYRESCPTSDLVYFIYTSTDFQTRENHLNDLLTVYHDSLLHFCRLLKKDPYPNFNVNTLKRRFHRAKIFGLLSAILVIPAMFQQHSQKQQRNQIVADANENFTDFLAVAKRAEDDIIAMQKRFTELSIEMCQQAVI